MTAAAFFDLDRTLLIGASGPVISEAMRAEGVIGPNSVPGEKLLFGLFDAIGETLPTMLITRQGARAAKGWSVEAVRKVGEAVAEPLAERVLPYARQAIDQHQAEGRPVVLATTTPYDLVKPLADELGLDGVVATRYGIDATNRDDLTYDGSVDGEFVWGRGKLKAVRAWGRAHQIDLSESWAYSDSVFDSPLLGAVGNPVAVNPDPRLLIVATAQRWPIVHFDVPPGVPKLLGIEPQRVLHVLARPELFPFARFDIEGVENIPKDGGAIMVGNHRSYFDVSALGMVLAQAGRPARFLGKKEVFDAPLVGQVARALGGIRVDRGTGSDRPLDDAADALAAGELVALMPQGTIPRGRAFFDPELKGRWGAVRLARTAGVPLVPVGLWGTEKVWPRSARVPNVLNVTDPPPIRIRVGAPFHAADGDIDQATAEMMERINALLPPEAHVRREPTPEELAAALPPGHGGDAANESERRPGSD
ncbi:MAG: HAD-IB family hydrolase [Actinomycetia bacterium]|nr:HAD-IB family hydrolase [Actinomycetes bacterium]MCP4087887.1 HAD-IB family hydrolase [Actinomycetes bacterium]